MREKYAIFVFLLLNMLYVPKEPYAQEQEPQQTQAPLTTPTGLSPSTPAAVETDVTQSTTQQTPPDTDNQPLEITADSTLEWKRNEQVFIARGNALAKQGEVSIAAQILTALYEDNEENGFQISQVNADENVRIISRDNTAFGQNAVYNLNEGKAVMTGDNLKLISPDQEVTARDRFEYWTIDGRLIALGKAKVRRKNPKGHYDVLESDKIVATLKENAQGQRVLDTLEAFGNVVITTPTEIVTGTYGIYRSGSNKAELDGNVVIRRRPEHPGGR